MELQERLDNFNEITDYGKDQFKQDHLGNLVEGVEDMYDVPMEQYTVNPTVKKYNQTLDYRGFQLDDTPVPQSAGESVGTAYEAFTLTDKSTSKENNQITAFWKQVEEIDKLRAEDGLEPLKDKFNKSWSTFTPWGSWYFESPYSRKFWEERYNTGKDIPDDYLEYFNSVKKYQKATTDGLNEISDKVTKTQALKLQQQMEQNSWYTNFAGTMGGSMTDPIVLSTLPFGTEAVLGSATIFGAKGILGTAGKAAAEEMTLAVASEIPIQMQVYQYKDDLDLPYSVQDAMINVAAAGLGAGLIRGAGSIAIDTIGFAKFKTDIGIDITQEEFVNLSGLMNELNKVDKIVQEEMFDVDGNFIGFIDVESPEYFSLKTEIQDVLVKDAQEFGLDSEQIKTIQDYYNNPENMTEILESLHRVSFLSNKLAGGEPLTEERRLLYTKELNDILNEAGILKRLYKKVATFNELEAKGIIKRTDEVVGITNEGKVKLEEYPELREKYESLTQDNPLHKATEEDSVLKSEGRIDRTPEEQEVHTKSRIEDKNFVTGLKNKYDIKGVDEVLQAVERPATKAEVQRAERLQQIQMEADEFSYIKQTFEAEIADLEAFNALTRAEQQKILKQRNLSKEEYETELFGDNIDILSKYKKLKQSTKKAKTIESKKSTKQKVKDQVALHKTYRDLQNKADKAQAKGKEKALGQAKKEIDQLDKLIEDSKLTVINTIEQARKEELPDQLDELERQVLERDINNDKINAQSTEMIQIFTDAVDSITVNDMKNFTEGKVDIDPLTGDIVSLDGRTIVKENEIDEFIEAIDKAIEIAC